MIHNNMMTGPVQSVSVATAASTNGRTPQVMLNNKMDLMSSVRLARRNQVNVLALWSLLIISCISGLQRGNVSATFCRFLVLTHSISRLLRALSTLSAPFRYLLQTLASGPTSLASGPTPSVEQRLALKLTATSTGPRRAPPQHEPAALPKVHRNPCCNRLFFPCRTHLSARSLVLWLQLIVCWPDQPGISGSVSHDLKPINCLPKTRPISEDEQSEAGIGGLAPNSAQVGPVGGKRMSAPRVTGTGVASKQPPRPPPRAAGVCLEDVDVTEPREANGASTRSPPER